MEIQKIAKLATKGADYYFEKIREQQSEVSTEDVSAEGETGDNEPQKRKTGKKDADKEKETAEQTTEG